MTAISNSLVKSVVLSAGLASVFAGTSWASELDGRRTLKPMQALTVDVGAKHGVGYFLSHDGHCKVVITVSEQSAFSDEEAFAATRYETAITPGASTTFKPGSGSSLVFQCQAGAQEMLVDVGSELAVK